MNRIVLALAIAFGLATVALTAGPAKPFAQEKKAAATVKAGKGEKVCRVKMQGSGEIKTWVCKTEEPCCVWHEINYVKCGSVTFKCL